MSSLGNKSNPSPDQSREGVGRWIAAVVSSIGSLIVFIALYRQFGTGSDWWTLAKIMAAVVIAFAVAGLIRFAFAPVVPSSLPASANVDPEIAMRSRIAPLVLGLGGVSIVILALAIVLSFAILSATDTALQAKIDTLLLGIFSSVLPVFATWVGTVIAFYFTNESFRQAAKATREAAEGVGSRQTWVSERMIPYEKIGKIETERAQVRAVKISEIVAKMQEPVTRIIIFDKARQPVFIVRRRLIPEDWRISPGAHTVDDYLKYQDGANAADASQFGYVPLTATLEAARNAMRESNSVDIFVTATGQKTEPVLGWLTDDTIRS
jgi:uncharacterized membrane protein